MLCSDVSSSTHIKCECHLNVSKFFCILHCLSEMVLYPFCLNRTLYNTLFLLLHLFKRVRHPKVYTVVFEFHFISYHKGKVGVWGRAPRNFFNPALHLGYKCCGQHFGATMMSEKALNVVTLMSQFKTVMTGTFVISFPIESYCFKRKKRIGIDDSCFQAMKSPLSSIAAKLNCLSLHRLFITVESGYHC